MPTTRMLEYRHERNARGGSHPIAPSNNHSAGVRNQMPGTRRIDGPRSPPNTLHVPCKFFRQGACQAGTACPFSHDTKSESICKYFAKGNCKFGPKCANIHLLPDGRRVNYTKGGVTIGAQPINLGTRVPPAIYGQAHKSALTNSFLGADSSSPYAATSPYSPQEDGHDQQQSRQVGQEYDIPTIDTTYSAHSSDRASAYGSSRDDDTPNRFGLGLSPVKKGLSVLDAPLPASFDSNGISHAARYGPIASSVPTKFGIDSPSPSHNPINGSDALRLLHTSAFGRDHSSTSALSMWDMTGFGISPPTTSTSLMAGDEYFGGRATHSIANRHVKQRLLNGSTSTQGREREEREWDQNFMFEEDYVPAALANEVLTPAEKARRGSTSSTRRVPDGESPVDSSSATRASAVRYGSPATAASPNRWCPIFHRQEETLDSSRSFKYGASAFGHVGSPLRKSSLANGSVAELNGTSANGRSSTSRPPNGGGAVSALTQQLQRTGFADESSKATSPYSHSSLARSPSALASVAVGLIGQERDRARGLERNTSSGSVGPGANGRYTTPLDVDDLSFVFRMEGMDDDDDALTRARKLGTSGHMATGSSASSEWAFAGNGHHVGHQPSASRV